MSSVYEQMQAAGCHPYEDPEALTEDQIDPRIWLAVRKINDSGWLWTGESCEGHPDADYPGPWAGNTSPYLRLILRTEDEPRLLPVLLDAEGHANAESMDDDPRTPHDLSWGYHPCWEMSVHSRRDGWTALYLYVQATTTWERNMGCRFLGWVGEVACRATPEPDEGDSLATYAASEPEERDAADRAERAVDDLLYLAGHPGTDDGLRPHLTELADAIQERLSWAPRRPDPSRPPSRPTKATKPDAWADITEQEMVRDEAERVLHRIGAIWGDYGAHGLDYDAGEREDEPDPRPYLHMIRVVAAHPTDEGSE